MHGKPPDSPGLGIPARSATGSLPAAPGVTPKAANGRRVWGEWAQCPGGHFVASNPRSKEPCVTRLTVTAGGTKSLPPSGIPVSQMVAPCPVAGWHRVPRPSPVPVYLLPIEAATATSRVPARGQLLPGPPGPIPGPDPVSPLRAVRDKGGSCAAAPGPGPLPWPVLVPPGAGAAEPLSLPVSPGAVRCRRGAGAGPAQTCSDAAARRRSVAARCPPPLPSPQRRLPPQPPAPARPHREERRRRPRALAGRECGDRSVSDTAPPPQHPPPRKPFFPLFLHPISSLVLAPLLAPHPRHSIPSLSPPPPSFPLPAHLLPPHPTPALPMCLHCIPSHPCIPYLPCTPSPPCIPSLWFTAPFLQLHPFPEHLLSLPLHPIHPPILAALPCNLPAHPPAPRPRTLHLHSILPFYSLHLSQPGLLGARVAQLDLGHPLATWIISLLPREQPDPKSTESHPGNANGTQGWGTSEGTWR